MRLHRLIAVGVGLALGAEFACCPDVTNQIALATGAWQIVEDPVHGNAEDPALFFVDGVDWTAIQIESADDRVEFTYFNPANDSSWRIEYAVPTSVLGPDCGVVE